MATRKRSIKRKARLAKGYPLSSGKTPKKPPKTTRGKRPWIDPGSGASKTFADRKRQTKKLREKI